MDEDEASFLERLRPIYWGLVMEDAGGRYRFATRAGPGGPRTKTNPRHGRPFDADRDATTTS